ncbi:Sden_1164 family protein [Streptomyces sp. NPDC001741]|uniref:Sden_1164 family protein n=1 Tax=Streptomyces sp. NPDC001741 TaxID=3364605 RepID=UPI0036C3F367
MLESAVVLAAGENRRMGNSSAPKSLLPLGSDDSAGPTFLSRHLGLLRRAGAERVFLVVSPANRAAFEPFADDVVELVVCGDGRERTGSSVSMLAGLRALLAWRPHGCRTVISDADIVYEQALLDHVSATRGSRLFTIERTNGDTEEVRVYGRSPAQPVLIGKGLASGMTSGLELLGESLGLILLDAAETMSVTELTRWAVGDPPRQRPYGYGGRLSEHEEMWQYLFTLGRLQVSRVSKDLLFSECDFPEDHAYVREELFPAITRRDRGAVAAPR